MPDYNYAQAGGYFVTVCCYKHTCLFGFVDEDGVMHRNAYGQIAWQEWEQMGLHRPLVELDAFVVMPNHVHGIVIIRGEVNLAPTHKDNQRRGDTSVARPNGPAPNSLGAIIGSYKSAVTRTINRMDKPETSVWQRSFHDVVIRNESMLDKLRHYIANNPAQWAEDRYFAPGARGI